MNEMMERVAEIVESDKEVKVIDSFEILDRVE